jgi:DNA-binding transcriptional regulator YiaG
MEGYRYSMNQVTKSILNLKEVKALTISITSAADRGERHLSMQDLADRCGVPLQTVRVWRVKGTGPRGMAIGKYVRYRLSDVMAWEESRADPKGAA